MGRKTLLEIGAAQVSELPQSPSGAGECTTCKVGDRVIVGSTQLRGLVKFAGATDFSSGEWIGVELNDPAGKNDGTVKGKAYFKCKPQHGIFVRPSSIVVEQLVFSGESNDKVGVESPSPSTSNGNSSFFAAATPVQAFAEAKEKAEEAAAYAKQCEKDVKLTIASSLPAARNIPNGVVTAASRQTAQQCLAEAMEDHDIDQLRRALPVAAQVGVDQNELDGAMRVLNFEVQRLLYQEVEEVRAVVSGLAECVALAQARAAAAETAVKHTTSQNGIGGTPGAAFVPSPPKPGEVPSKEWVKQVGAELEGRVWTGLNVRVENAVASAVDQATKVIQAAVSELRTASGESPKKKAKARIQMTEDEAAAKIQAIGRGNAVRKASRQDNAGQDSDVRKEVIFVVRWWLASAHASLNQRIDVVEDRRQMVEAYKRRLMAGGSSKFEAQSKEDAAALKMQAFSRGRADRKRVAEMKRSGMKTEIKRSGTKNLKRLQSSKKLANDSANGDSSVRKQLERMRPSQLRKEALKRGVSLERIEEAEDADDPKEAFVELILAAPTNQPSMANDPAAMSKDELVARVRQLESLLPNMQDSSAKDIEALRSRMKEDLTYMHRNGALEAALNQPQSASDIDALRLRAKGDLIQMNRDRLRGKDVLPGRQEGAARILQKSYRKHRARNLNGQGIGDMREVALAMIKRNQAWDEIFSSYLQLGVANLQCSGFSCALREIHPRLTSAQALVLWRGFCSGAGEDSVDRDAFQAISEAVAIDDHCAAEFAEMSVEVFRQLGLQGGDDAAKRLQAAHRGFQVRKQKRLGQLKPADRNATKQSAATRTMSAKNRAASNVQAIERGRQQRLACAQREEQQQAKRIATREETVKATTSIQAAVRRLQARKKYGGAKVTFAIVAAQVKVRFKAWAGIFDKAGVLRQFLTEPQFATALLQVHPHYTKSQVSALYTGFVEGTGLEGVDMMGYCSIVEAGHIGDDAISEFADIDVEDWKALAAADAVDSLGMNAAADGGHLDESTWRKLRPDYAGLFDEAKDGDGQLDEPRFTSTMTKAHPRLSRGQLHAMWIGFMKGTNKSKWDLEDFCSAAEAVEIGDDAAAEFADIASEHFATLGAAGGESAATKLQATHRGKKVRASMAQAKGEKMSEKKREAALKLQSLGRMWLARRKCAHLGNGANAFFKATVAVKVRNTAWIQICEEAVTKQNPGTQNMQRESFPPCMAKVAPQVTSEQLNALWEGTLDGLGTKDMDIKTFCSLCTAVLAGDEQASQFADMDVADYVALGKQCRGGA